jgi:hypothetical protein
MDLMILVKNCLFKNSLGRKPKWGNLGGTWASGGTQAVLEQCLILLSWRSLPYTRKVKKHLIAKTVATGSITRTGHTMPRRQRQQLLPPSLILNN